MIRRRCSIVRESPILEPDLSLREQGFKAGVVYSCGAVIKDGELYVYYGGARFGDVRRDGEPGYVLERAQDVRSAAAYAGKKTEREGPMAGAKRSSENPILIPDASVAWEAEAAFNPSVVEGKDGKVHMLFRAAGAKQNVNGREVEISSIGHTASGSAMRFNGEHHAVHRADGGMGALRLRGSARHVVRRALLYFLYRRLGFFRGRHQSGRRGHEGFQNISRSGIS